MTGVNKAIIVGHLGADPEIRRDANGRQLASLSVATSERWNDKTTGEKRERTDWHRVVIFNEGIVGVAEKYLKKGAKVYVEGAMRYRTWTDKKGIERSVTEVVLGPFNSSLVMLDRAERAPAPTEEDYAGKPLGQPPAEAPAEFNDNIPF
jgi:single-strand DNA-binding protein